MADATQNSLDMST